MAAVSSNPFSVSVGPLQSTGDRMEVECAGHMAELSTSGSYVSESDEVRFAGTIEAIEGARFVVEGNVTSRWHGECRRCLNDAGEEISVRVREYFGKDPGEEDIYIHQGASVDLEPMLREIVMLELPVVALCSDNCPGLCPNCGQDLKQGSCDCRVDNGDPRWAALDDLKTD